MDLHHLFAPHAELARDLLPLAVPATDDASHDISHLLRVWKNVQTLSEQEGGEAKILTAATLLHDCVDVPKDSPLRSSASRLAAERASQHLVQLGWGRDDIARVAHAIEAHSFSANIAPQSKEAEILQDADRLDALGFVGIARCFYVSGRLGRGLYDPRDPSAASRDLDDTQFAIDHFQTKLLKLAGSFKTQTGRALAAQRHAALQAFFHGFVAEVSAP